MALDPSTLTLNEEIKNLVEGLQRRQKDLTDFQVPRLHKCKGTLVEQERYAAELKEDLEVFGRQTDALYVKTNDYIRRADREALLQLVAEFREASSKIRRDMRAALLNSKKTIDSQAKTDREKLFAGARIDTRDVEEKATDDALMKANNDVTDALRQTIGLMQSELERSVLSHQILEKSTATLRSTGVQHDVLASATNTSRQLITALEKADWLDRLLVFAALAFFILVVLFIIKQRILDRSIRIAFWWTRFIASSSSRTIGTPTMTGSEPFGTTSVKEALHIASSAVSGAGDRAQKGVADFSSATVASVLSSAVESASETIISLASDLILSSAPEAAFTAESAIETATGSLNQHVEL